MIKLSVYSPEYTQILENAGNCYQIFNEFTEIFIEEYLSYAFMIVHVKSKK